MHDYFKSMSFVPCFKLFLKKFPFQLMGFPLLSKNPQFLQKHITTEVHANPSISAPFFAGQDHAETAADFEHESGATRLQQCDIFPSFFLKERTCFAPRKQTRSETISNEINTVQKGRKEIFSLNENMHC